MTTLLRAAAILIASLLPAFAVSAATSPETVEGATTVTPEEALALFDAGVVFVDTRSDSGYEAGRIPGAVHLDLDTFFAEDTLEEVVAKDAPVVFYCNGHSCMRSSEASALAVGWGFTQVYYLRDGYPAWENAGYPVE